MGKNSNNSKPSGVMTGGRCLAEMMRLAKVGPIFGMGGFQMLPYYDSLRQMGMEHNLVNDERSGALMADAYARITGKPGVCDGTAGPGAINLTPSLIESLNAGVPLIAVIGDTHRAHSWKNMTQETRQVDILRPTVKEVIRVEMIERLPEAVRRAFSVATSGRPGPVLLDIPEDVFHGEYDFSESDFHINEATLRIPSVLCRPDDRSLEKAAEMLAKAKRPMILAGGGIHLSGAQKELVNFAETYNIPVANTLSGKGAIADAHELSLGLFGRYSRVANDLMETADCLLVVGCKMGEIATRRYSMPKADIPLIHIDLVAEEFERCSPADLRLWGDAGETLRGLSAAMTSKSKTDRSAFFAEIKERKAKWAEEAEQRYHSAEEPINMGRLLHEINNFMPAGSVFIGDGGFAAHWGGLLYDTPSSGRTFVANRGFASLGYGVPAGIGAALAMRDLGRKEPVISLTGDGGLNMSIGDLETAVRTKAEFILVVVNNAASGYIRALQHLMFGPGNYQSSKLMEIDYASLAHVYGCYGIRVEKPGDLAGALRQAASNKGAPTVLDVVVTRDPAQMLPGVDTRAAKIKPGDRIA